MQRMDNKNKPYSCAECKHAQFMTDKPLCKVNLREFEHNTAKQVAVWCPLKLKVVFHN